MSREVMQMALDMLNEIADDVYCDQKLEGVIAVLRQALEEKQEPLYWSVADGWVTAEQGLVREWVGLTDEEISAVDWKPNETLHDYAKHIELKLRGKNT